MDADGKLFRLSKLDKFEVAKNDPDVRGWDMIDLNGERLGKVTELIADVEAQKVRYLEVEVDKDVARMDGQHFILVPIGITRLHRKDDNVMVENMTRASVRNYPMYTGGVISREYELELRRALDMDTRSISSISPSRTTTGNPGPDADRIEENRRFVEQHQTAQSALDSTHAGLEARRTHTDELRAPDDAPRRQYETAAADLRDSAHTSDTWEKYQRMDKDSLLSELKSAFAQRDIAMRERDIARAERDILRLERDNLLNSQHRNSGINYSNDLYSDSRFYENRRREEKP
jgi:hypothetical protein